jgi:hypothetical protein
VRAVALLVVAGCVFTRVPETRERPRWQPTSDARFTSACVDAHAFVRKSGKQGLGLAIQLASHHDCHVRISGTWHLGGAATRVGPVDVDLHGRSLRYAWLPVAFDGNAAWNAGQVDGQLVLVVDSGEAQAPLWTIALHDELHELSADERARGAP